MSRRRRSGRRDQSAIAMTPALREAFRLVPSDAECVGGRVWFGSAHTTVVCRFRSTSGELIRAKLRLVGDRCVGESATFELRVR